MRVSFFGLADVVRGIVFGDEPIGSSADRDVFD